MLGLRASPELREAIERWAKKQDDKPKLSEAIRRLVELALASAISVAAQTNEKEAAKASNLAGQLIDILADGSAPVEEREKRKRRLLKGPREFRAIRKDHPTKR